MYQHAKTGKPILVAFCCLSFLSYLVVKCSSLLNVAPIIADSQPTTIDGTVAATPLAAQPPLPRAIPQSQSPVLQQLPPQPPPPVQPPSQVQPLPSAQPLPQAQVQL